MPTKNFENNIVLTSQNPEAWLVFGYDGNDTIIEPSINFTDENVWINGWNYQTIADASGAGIILNADTSIAPFHIYTDSKEDFDYNLRFLTPVTGSQILTGWVTPTSPNVLSFLTSGRNITDCSVNSLGAIIVSNTESVTSGGVNLDISINYTILSGTAKSISVFEDYNSFSLATATYNLSAGQNNFNHITNSATTSVFIRFNYLFTFGRFSADVDIFEFSGELYVDVSIYNRPYVLDSAEINTFETFDPLVDNEASYLLLRTNPKYSGNIKLVADVSNNLYLDTFKVSDILSNKKYRKQKVSGDSFLSGDIRRVFSTLPSGEIFRLSDEDTLNISLPKTAYRDQFETAYDYGAKMLADELYDEEYSILAPLWINSEIPDYFVLFRLDGTFNPDSYDSGDLSNIAEEYLKKGNIIESWKLTENSPIGTYLNNHLSELLNFESPVTLSLNEYDPNTWNGIAVDKGIIAGRSEVPYFFQQVTNNFTETNAFVSRGFEREGLLCPNLVNMEFIFNDTDVSNYTMSRYFGFYMEENELYRFSYYSDSSENNSFRIISLDEKDVSLFLDSSIFDSEGNIISEYQNRIFVRNDGVDLTRICCTSQIDGSRAQIDNYINKLGTNIISTIVEKKKFNPFITLTLNTRLPQGEHLRIINKSSGIIWEIYGVETDYFSAGEWGPYVSFNEPSVGYPKVYRTSFSVKGDINDQITAITGAFNSFREYENFSFSVGMTRNNSLSIVLDDGEENNYTFQRLTGQIAYSIGDPSSFFNSAAAPEDITYFGVFTPDSSDFERIPYDASYGPIDFELYGDRFSIFVDLIDTSMYNVYSFDSSTTENFTDNVLYIGNDGWNRLIQSFDVSAGSMNSYLWSMDPTSVDNKSVIITEKPIRLDQTKVWYGYDVYPISVSLMGINPVKYFDYTIYDSSLGFESNYRTSKENDEETYRLEIPLGSSKTLSGRNSYIVTSGDGTITINGNSELYSVTPPNTYPFNTFFGSAEIVPTSDTIIKYNTLDGSFNYVSYDPSVSEESIDDYYRGDNKTELKYGLVVPTITKWGTNGRDSRGNPVRLNLTTQFFDDPSSVNSNFIPVPDTSLYQNEVSYPVFKYLSAGEDSWKSYVYYDVNDVVNYNGVRKSIRQLMFEEPEIDFFSKILYNNSGVSGDATRSSILYYNLYENKVITILSGIKIGIGVNPEGEQLYNIRNWDRYKFSIISSPWRNNQHNKPVEVIINENTETILVIWYQGADILHYNKRYSNETPGKNILIDTQSTGNKSFMGFVDSDPSYSFVKSPFIIRTDETIVTIKNIYEESDISNYDTSIVSPLAQMSYNKSTKFNSIFNAYETSTGTNQIVGGTFFFNKSFDSFNQNEIDYVYVPDSASFGGNVANLSYNYLNNYNYYKEKTCNINLLKNIISNNNIEYYIIQENNITGSTTFSSQPISLTIFDVVEYKSPNYDASIYTYNGPYVPIFKNILNFEDNETNDLIDIFEKDFVFSNTNLQSYNYIDQYWGRRVVETVTPGDSSNNIIFVKDFNPFKSLWDANYFVLSEGSSQTFINGYNSDLEHSSMFGSKLISLPNKLIIDNWNSTNSKLVTKTDYYSMEFNLSKAITELFTNNNTFIDNWSGLSVDNDVINKYINRTVLQTYNVNINKIITEVTAKPFNGQILNRTDDGSFLEIFNNFESELTVVNDEYIYKVKIYEGINKSFFTRFVFTKK